MNLFKKDPLQIITFRSYGTSTHLYVKGRALEDENIDLSKKGVFSLLWNSYKRFETDLIINTNLVLTLSDGRKFETKTDEQGYFLIDETVANLLPLIDENGCFGYEISFLENFEDRKIQNQNRFKGEVFIPFEEAKLGIISDIDDTILHTGLTSKLRWKVAKNTLLKSAENRVPLEGAADFYEKLKHGKSGQDNNPIFYVSHSPWNLYRYLEVFLEKHNFPKGPILLRDFVNPFAKKYKPEKPQKQQEIINIMKTYPKLSFILIGDSGEHDPDIYTEIAEAHPERILAIYLRNVNHKKKMIRVKGLFDKYETVPVLLVEDTKAAIKHATEMGFL